MKAGAAVMAVVLMYEFLLKARIPSWRKELGYVVIAVIGAALAWLHARWLDPAYLRAGRREAL